MDEYIKRLEELALDRDHEAAHSEADGILCEILLSLGLDEVVAAYNDIDKWYA